MLTHIIHEFVGRKLLMVIVLEQWFLTFFLPRFS